MLFHIIYFHKKYLIIYEIKTTKKIFKFFSIKLLIIYIHTLHFKLSSNIQTKKLLRIILI